jgi:hypothetical protein
VCVVWKDETAAHDRRSSSSAQLHDSAGRLYLNRPNHRGRVALGSQSDPNRRFKQKMFLARNAGNLSTVSRQGLLASIPSLGSSPSILRGGSQSDSSMRFLSSRTGNKKKYDFRPRRRTPRTYRPVDAKAFKPKGPKEPFDISRSPRRIVTPADIKITDATEEDELEAFGPLAADAIRLARKHGDDLFTGGKPGSKYDVETQLRMMDYFTSAPGSTEDLVGERRALAFDMWDFEDRDHYATAVAEMIEEERIRSLEMAPTQRERDEDLEPEIDSSETSIPSSQLAHGEW